MSFLPGEEDCWYQWMEEKVGKEHGANTVYTCKWKKMIPVERVPEMGEGWI
jgi:hypothetical protein